MAIREDAASNEDTGFTRQEAESAFLEKWKEDAEKPSKPSKGAKEDEEDETPPDSSDDDTEELYEEDDSEDAEDQSDDDADETIAGDTAKVKVTVDGEEKTVSVKDLKRLFGQEASLTRKSQEVAAKRKEAEA